MLARSIAATAVLTLAFTGASDAKGKKGDADGDGLKDRVEVAAGLDPKRADSDGDGVKDGREGVGEVVKVRGDWVSVKLLGGETVRAKVTDATKLACVVAEDEEPEDDLLEDELAEEEGAELFEVPEDGVEEASDDALLEDEEDAEEEDECSADDLAKGVTVLGSSAKGKGKRARWTRLELEV